MQRQGTLACCTEPLFVVHAFLFGPEKAVEESNGAPLGVNSGAKVQTLLIQKHVTDSLVHLRES